MEPKQLIKLLRDFKEKKVWSHQEMANYIGLKYRTYQEIASTGVIAKQDTYVRVMNKLGYEPTLFCPKEEVVEGTNKKSKAQEEPSFANENNSYSEKYVKILEQQVANFHDLSTRLNRVEGKLDLILAEQGRGNN